MPVRVLGSREGKSGFLGTTGVRFMIEGNETGGRFSLVEHPMPPRALGAPLHRHSREDEYTYVVKGRIGVLIGEDVVLASQGDLVFKPRNQWHTFWNAGDEPASILEMISPAGFENYFHELSALGGGGNISASVLAELSGRYGLEVAVESMPELAQRFELRFPPDSPPKPP